MGVTAAKHMSALLAIASRDSLTRKLFEDELTGICYVTQIQEMVGVPSNHGYCELSLKRLHTCYLSRMNIPSFDEKGN